MEHNAAFGAAFRRLRRLKGLTQEDFGSVISERYVRMLEKGEYSPTLSTMADIARVLGVSIVTLIALVQAEQQSASAMKLLDEAVQEVKTLE